MMRYPATLSLLRWRGGLSGLAGLMLASTVCSQDVSLSGTTADKALLVIDNSAPRFVATGQSVNGVKLVKVQGDQAVVEVQGQRRTLAMGDAPIAAAPSGGGHSIVLVADAQGHFLAEGWINGKPMRFLLDTGATSLALSESDAKRMGLPYLQGRKVQINTANGATIGYYLQLNSVRLGGHTAYNVSAVVQPADMPFALLGNSFLARFNMRRENDRMILEPRY